jgi:hypothetical protein
MKHMFLHYFEEKKQKHSQVIGDGYLCRTYLSMGLVSCTWIPIHGMRSSHLAWRCAWKSILIITTQMIRMGTNPEL